MNLNIQRFHAPWLFSLIAFLALDVWAVDPEPGVKEMIERLGLRESDKAMREYDWWRKPEKIGVLMPEDSFVSSADRLQRMRTAVGSDVEIFEITGANDPRVKDLEVIVNYCTPQMLQAAPKLRYLHNYGVGVDRCGNMPGIEKYDFVLTNAQGASGPTIAEHAIALMMSLTHSMNVYYRRQLDVSRNQSSPVNDLMMDVEGKTLLVAGLGGIGGEVAQKASALGMRVIATRNSSRNGPDYVEYVGLPHELYELAARADVVVNALPLTEETRYLFDKKFFDAVKPGVYFISVGRGPSTVTADLIAALKDGRVKAAGLDVTDPEGLPPSHELLQMNNVIVTPHISSHSAQGRERMAMLAIENVRRYVAGEKLLNIVNLSAGY